MINIAAAAAAIAATSSFVGVHASTSTSSSTSTSKSGKGSCSSSPKLEKFCNEEPVNFAGTYDLCYQQVIRNSASGYKNGAFNICWDQMSGPVFDRVFTPLDDYGAYSAAVNHPGGALLFQGIAQGSFIKMTTYGGGVVNGDGDIEIPNETPDTQECTRYEDGILKCMYYFQEYCGSNTANETVLPSDSDCKDGEWSMTYTVEAVLVLEGSECPEPPKGFCDDDHMHARKLQEEKEEKNEVGPCPFMNKKMN